MVTLASGFRFDIAQPFAQTDVEPLQVEPRIPVPKFRAVHCRAFVKEGFW